MNRVFGVGPVETNEGDCYLLTLMNGVLAADFESGPTALDALRELVDRHGAAELVAGPELRDEADALGVSVEPLPRSIGELRASQTLMVGNQQFVRPEASLRVPELLSNLVEYVAAAPWEWLNSDTPLRVHWQAGDERRTLEASILGNAGEVLGLALYDHPGSIAKITRGARPADVVVLTLDDEPDWAVEAMRAGFGLPFFPAVSRVRNNRPLPLHEGDLERLEAVLGAVARLTPTEDAVEGSYHDGRREVCVSVELGELGELDELAELGELADPPRAAPAKVARNARCPCGSGRKYKRCCMRKHEAARPRAKVAQPRAKTLVDRMLAEVMREEPAHGIRWTEALLGSSELPQHLTPAIIPLLLYELPLADGELLGRRFLARHGRRLGANERRALEASLAASFSIWEVLRVDRGRGLELVDLLTGERCFVHEVSATHSAKVRAGLLARVIELGDRRELDGLYPYHLSPASTDEVVAALRSELGVRKNKKWVDRELLRTPEVAESLFRLWHERVNFDHEDAQQPVELVTTDGDPAENVRDRYELLDVPDAVVELMLELPGANDEGVDDDDGAHVIGVLREGNAMHRHWLYTGVGQVRVRGSTLTLRTNSRPRADALRDAVEARLGLFARFVGREIEAFPVMRQPGGGRVAIDSQPVRGWFGSPTAMAYGLHLRSWRHEPNQALDGQTPCEAVARAASRRKLHALLRRQEHGAGEDGREAFASLRAELGIDELGERVRVTLEHRTAAKISWRLLEFAMPLLVCSADEDEGEAILRVAAEVWNCVGELDPDAKLDRRELLDYAHGALAAHELRVDDHDVNRWIDVLIPLRPLYDDPRIVQILAIARTADGFNCKAAAMMPR